MDLYLSFFQNREAIGGPKSAPVHVTPAESHKIILASFFNVMSNFLEAGVKVVLVCDGNDKPAVKRLKKRMNYTKEMSSITAFREIAKSMNIRFVDAAGEGEAQCAHMQRHGLADFAYTEDSDVIIFGARRIMRKLKKAKDAPKTQTEGRYAVYEIPDNHKWASPEKLLCYAILRGGDYSTGGKHVADVYAAAIAQGGDWAKRLYEVSKPIPNVNSVHSRGSKEKELRKWAKELQAEIVQPPIPQYSKKGALLKKVVIPRSELFKDLKSNIGNHAVIVAPELDNIFSYAKPKVVKTYDFDHVPEFKLDYQFFRSIGLELGWINKENNDALLFKRLARPKMVLELKNGNHGEFFTFVNQRDKSTDKDLYSIEYCPHYVVQYPEHTCCISGEDACARVKSTVSASILMQSKFNYKQIYVDMVTNGKAKKPRAKKGKHAKTSSTSSNSSISSFYTVIKTKEPAQKAPAATSQGVVIPEEVYDSEELLSHGEYPPETVSSADELMITDEKPAAYDGKYGYGADFDWDLATQDMGKGRSVVSCKPAKQTALPGLSRVALSRKPVKKVTKKACVTGATKAARKQSTLSFLSSKSSIVEVGPGNLNQTIVLSDSDGPTEEDEPVNLDSSPVKIQKATRIGTKDSTNHFSQQTFVSSTNDDYTQPFQSFTASPPFEPECIELSD